MTSKKIIDKNGNTCYVISYTDEELIEYENIQLNLKDIIISDNLDVPKESNSEESNIEESNITDNLYQIQESNIEESTLLEPNIDLILK